MKEKALRYRGHNGARTNKTIKVGFKKEIKGLFLISLRNNDVIIKVYRKKPIDFDWL